MKEDIMINKIPQNDTYDESDIYCGDNPNINLSDRDTELIAKSLEFMFPLFLKIDMQGIELVRIIGNGHESNNHEALVTFIKKLDQKLLELPSQEHLNYVKDQLEDIFIQYET